MGMQWTAWGTTVRVEVTDPGRASAARRIVARCVADAERAAELGNARAEVYRSARSAGRPVDLRAGIPEIRRPLGICHAPGDDPPGSGRAVRVGDLDPHGGSPCRPLHAHAILLTNLADCLDGGAPMWAFPGNGLTAGWEHDRGGSPGQPSGLPVSAQAAWSLLGQPDAMQTSTLSADVAGRPPAAAPASAAPIVVPPADPSWAKPALAALLGLTAVLYLWGLSASGWGNAFYAAAVQAGTVSWKAFFYGSSDAGNSITVDKTPLSLWVMVASARIFGVNSWSILAPQAVMGVATVGVLYASVRRWFGAAAGLIAGLVLALTPVAVLMFRFDNPDASLVLLLTLGAYAMIRALDAAASRAGTRWLVLAGVLVGLAFMSKMLQALLVVPAFALVYLLFAAVPLRRRLGRLVLSGVGLIVSAGWWIAVVELVPASMRPYIGGSQTNSVFDLMLGYNGFGRLTG
ncbi:MAG TPA: glycosyltransferase family 39 protein, partial [Kineosporiaceae bacterium]|nr:glycosyltransferase family 39 protein [Kineosporiaceae bacterium]